MVGNLVGVSNKRASSTGLPSKAFLRSISMQTSNSERETAEVRAYFERLKGSQSAGRGQVLVEARDPHLSLRLMVLLHESSKHRHPECAVGAQRA